MIRTSPLRRAAWVIAGWVTMSSVVATGAASAAPAPAPGAMPRVGVSPLLVDAAATVWSVIATRDNPVWPGWDASDTPLLLYLPGEEDLLIGHPHPPAGFVPYNGPLEFPGRRMMVKEGPTLIAEDGQNTSMDVAGTQTLVVADPLSNLRQKIGGLLLDPRPAEEKARTLSFDDIRPDPYDPLGLVVHEAFHVYQERMASARKTSEMLLLFYPVLSVENNAGFGMEGEALARALAATDEATFRAEALRWLAARTHRRATLPPRAIAYEDGVEFFEGLARYTEYRLFQVLEGRPAPPGLRTAQGFAGFSELSERRRALVAQIRRYLRGEVNVNNDPYGTAPVRMRLYYSGMGVAVMLDRLSPTWKHDVIATDRSLTALAAAALGATPDTLVRAWESMQADTAYASLRAAKTRLAEEGRRRAEARLAAIENGPGTGVVVDYSRLTSDKVGLGFTPFGILSVDSSRTIFGQVPIRARFSDESSLEESIALPLLRDTERRLVRCRLERELSRAEIEKLMAPDRLDGRRPGPVRVELPGVVLDLKRATLAWRAGSLVATLSP